MFRGQKVKIRLKRLYSEQRVRILVGTVLDMNNEWLKVEGKFYYLIKGKMTPRIDEKARLLGIPRENIHILRVLPSNLDLNDLKYTIKNNRIMIDIENHQPVSISEY